MNFRISHIKLIILLIFSLLLIPFVLAQYINPFDYFSSNTGVGFLDVVVNLIGSIGHLTALDNQWIAEGFYRMAMFTIVSLAAFEGSKKIGMSRKLGGTTSIIVGFIGAFAAPTDYAFAMGNWITSLVMIGLFLFMVFWPLYLIFSFRHNWLANLIGILGIIVLIFLTSFFMGTISGNGASLNVGSPGNINTGALIGLLHYWVKKWQ